MLNTNLNQAILNELLTHLRRGEIAYCTHLGFEEKELAALEQLSYQEICDLGESKACFATVNINHQAFWSLLEVVKEKSGQRNIIDRALTLGASSEILYELYGLSSAEVSARRKLLGIKESMGRKPNADENEEHRVWELWTKERESLLGKAELFELSHPDVFHTLMFIAEETKVSLTEVVRLVRQGEQN